MTTIKYLIVSKHATYNMPRQEALFFEWVDTELVVAHNVWDTFMLVRNDCSPLYELMAKDAK